MDRFGELWRVQEYRDDVPNGVRVDVFGETSEITRVAFVRGERLSGPLIERHTKKAHEFFIVDDGKVRPLLFP